MPQQDDDRPSNKRKATSENNSFVLPPENDETNNRDSSSLTTTIRLNNLGVRFVENQSYEEAIHAFKNAMASLKFVIQLYVRANRLARANPTNRRNNNSGQQQRQQRQVQRRRQYIQASFERTLHQQELEKITSSQQDPSSSQKYLFLFRHPLKISPLLQEQEQQSPSNYYTEISIILTYNLALAYHLEALTTTTNRNEKLSKSLDLYGMALNLLIRDQSLKHNAITCTTAVLNNMGSAHHCLGNFNLSKKVFERMLSLIMVELASSPSGRQRPTQLAQDLDGFFTNINRFLYVKPSAAAA